MVSVNQTPVSVLNVCLPDVTVSAASVDCTYNFAYTSIVTFGGILKPAFSARLIRPYLRYQFACINVNISAVAPLFYRMTSEVFDIHCDVPFRHASHFLTPLIPSPILTKPEPPQSAQAFLLTAVSASLYACSNSRAALVVSRNSRCSALNPVIASPTSADTFTDNSPTSRDFISSAMFIVPFS